MSNPSYLLAPERKDLQMVVKVSTELPIAAELACQLAQRPAVFKHVVWPVFTILDAPEHLAEGERLVARLHFLGLLPTWKHHLLVVSVGPREIYSNEHGGPVKVWNHRLTFEPISDHACRYTDEVEIQAGALTFATVLFARAMYNWRQWRWRRLARLIG
jgi:hypothetical protein